MSAAAAFVAVVATTVAWLGRARLPPEFAVILIGKRRAGEVAVATESAIVLSAVISVVLVVACAVTFVWLAGERGDDVDRTRSTIVVATTVLGAPVAVGFMLSALTGWPFWLMGLFAVALLLLFLSVRATRRWQRASRSPE